MQNIDLRSDTLTLPTPAMRLAMGAAEVGDDVFGEDPTITRLEEIAAEITGKEAALMVSSGTMGNLIAQMVHCQRGDEIIIGNKSHVFLYEQGGSASIAGVHAHALLNEPDGTIRIEAMERAIRPDNDHYPISRLIILENTHNRCYGMPLPLSYLESVRALADQRELKIHMDGARVFNAAAALNEEVKTIAAWTDSITFCLSKGLAAPVGSCLCGSKAFIKKARRARKVLGGGMRQAGILAAAGLLALDEMTERLKEDHENASALATGINKIKGLEIDLSKVKTNIVYITVTAKSIQTEKIVEKLGEKGVHLLKLDENEMRAVTHYHITPEDITHAIAAFKSVMTTL